MRTNPAAMPRAATGTRLSKLLMLASAVLQAPCQPVRSGTPSLSSIPGDGSDVRLKIFDVPGDGDCLFSAVALSAALTDGLPAPSATELRVRAAELRIAAVTLLCPAGAPDPDLILGELPADLIIEPLPGEDGVGYCRRMRRPGQWGSLAEILVLSKVLQRPIAVHAAFGVDTYGDNPSGGAGPAEDDTGRVKTLRPPLAVYFQNSHYRAALLLRGGAACDATTGGPTEPGAHEFGNTGGAVVRNGPGGTNDDAVTSGGLSYKGGDGESITGGADLSNGPGGNQDDANDTSGGSCKVAAGGPADTGGECNGRGGARDDAKDMSGRGSGGDSSPHSVEGVAQVSLLLDRLHKAAARAGGRPGPTVHPFPHQPRGFPATDIYIYIRVEG